MKLHQILEEQTEQLGLVYTRDKEDGKFEDVELVDFKTTDIISTRTGHAKNVFDYLVRMLRETGKWDEFEKYVKQKSEKAKKLGEEWGDAESFEITMYGPFTSQKLAELDEFFEDE